MLVYITIGMNESVLVKQGVLIPFRSSCVTVQMRWT